MAKMQSIYGFTELEKQLSSLSRGSIEIGKKAVRKGAGILADQVRANLRKNLAGSEYSTGDLEESLGVTPAGVDRNGVINAKVGFDGYDRKGVPNQLKARAMESGTSRQRKRPFIRPAVNKAKQKVEKAMEQTIDEEISKIVKE